MPKVRLLGESQIAIRFPSDFESSTLYTRMADGTDFLATAKSSFMTIDQGGEPREYTFLTRLANHNAAEYILGNIPLQSR